MATKKRPSSRSRLLNRAVKAGRSYLREAERRLPPEVRRQIDRGIKDGQKTVEGAIKQLRSRLDRTASQVDLEKALKRLDGLTKQVQQMARSASFRPAATAATASAARRAARKPATRSKARTDATTKTAAAPKATATRKAPARTAAPRRRTAAPAAVTPPTVESPSMAIPDPSPREPAG